MANSLVFPDSLRLANRDELPGPEAERELAWSRIQAAQIRMGFVLFESRDPTFAFYGEANVHAPKIWIVFRDLCEHLLGRQATLVMGEIDDDPAAIGTAEVGQILRLLEPHAYQLAHDGWLQFGLVHQGDNRVAEVFVAPTKHFKLWFDDAAVLRSVMRQHGVPEVHMLQFIDEYPHVTIPLAPEKTAFREAEDLIQNLEMTFKGVQGA